jgi:hypothetical protein
VSLDLRDGRSLARGLHYGLAAAGRFLALAQDARLLIIFTAAGLGEDTVLLHLLIEAAQCALETFVIANCYFTHFKYHPLAV